MTVGMRCEWGSLTNESMGLTHINCSSCGYEHTRPGEGERGGEGRERERVNRTAYF